MGRTLALTREHAAAVSAGKLAFVDLATSQVRRIDMPNVVDMAIVDDELWVAGGAPVQLHRFGIADGTRTGEPVPLWGHGRLVEAALGTGCALWSAPPPAIVEAERVTPVPGEWDFVLPVAPTRWLTCRRQSVMLRDPSSERWGVKPLVGSGRVVDGAVLFDGSSAALAIASHSGALAQLIVLGLHNGVLQHRVTLIGIEHVRFAPARGYALFIAGDRMVVFDLRFGRVLKEHVERQRIVDAAIDASGQTFVVRYGNEAHDIAFGSIRELLGERLATPTAPATTELVEAAVELEPAPAPMAVEPEFHRGHPALPALPGLAPRPRSEVLAPNDAIALLERHGQVVTALVAHAIALGWDTGRLGFPNESALPFRGEVTGILGESSGRARDELAQAERRLARATAALADAEAAVPAGKVAPLAALAVELGLSPVAQQVLLLVAGPSIWGELARLYGVLGNDEERALVDEMLLVQILAGRVSRSDIARELDRESPLVRFGLVRIAEGRGRPFAGMVCDPVVLRLLHGERDIELDDVTRVAATRTFEELLIPATAKADFVRLLGTGAASRIVVRGRRGAGRHTLLATLGATANRRLAVIDVTSMLVSLANRIGQLRAALARAHMCGMLPCVDGIEGLAADDRAGRDLLARVLDEHPGPLAIRLSPEARPIIEPGYVALDLPPLGLVQRTACWQIVLAGTGLFVRDPSEIADRFGIGPGIVYEVCTRVAAEGPVDATVDRTPELDRTIRQYLESGLGATATRVARLASWSRVVLPADVQDSVLELIARIKHRRTVYDHWGYDRLLTTARGVTALFQGGPGTGKTLVAGAIANELGMDLYRVDLSRIMSKWIGETEQNLAKLFDAAEDGHAIILFDEADSLFAKRTEVKSSVDRYANLEVNYLLQRLDSFEGIAILTTNFGTSIDTAFKRRLSFRLTFPFPDEEAREALWRAHIATNIPKAGAFDFADLARRYRLSGGYIRNAALRAAFLAAGEQTPLTQDHLVRAIQAEFREIGKIAESGVLE